MLAGEHGWSLQAAVLDEHLFRPSISSAAASPALPSVSPASDRETRTNAGSGPRWLESYARLGPDGSWLKIHQGYAQLTLDGSADLLSESLPRSGIASNGRVYRRQPLVPLTSAIASSSWRTPQSYSFDQSHRPGITKLDVEVRGMYPTPKGSPDHFGQPRPNDRGDLQAAVLLPTPTQSDATGGPGSSGRDGGLNPRTAVNGQLSADWVSLLMGFPIHWTVVDGSAECRES